MKSLSRNHVKLLAIAAMTLNHIAYLFLPDGVLKLFLVGLGNGTAVTMVCFLVDGYFYTHSRKRYAIRLFLTALLSQLPFAIAFEQFHIGLNMMFSLLFALAACRVYEVENKILRILLFIPIFILSLFSDWRILPVIYAVAFMMEKKGKMNRFAAGITCLLVFMMWEGAAHPFIILLNSSGFILFLFWYLGEWTDAKEPPASKVLKYFFYLYYPLHLSVLAIIKNTLF